MIRYCENCEFYYQAYNYGGYCRFDPPKKREIEVSHKHWCGKFLDKDITESLNANIVKYQAILQAIEDCLKGIEPTGFAATFDIVQNVWKLKQPTLFKD
jgi:hypothetical protein